jgi:serine/threonine protein kinase
MAPECLEKKIYSFKTDVWSWAVTVWEIFSREIPFAELDNMQTIIAILKGERLKIPEKCPNFLEKLLHKCWSINPENRPTFHEILLELNKIEI